MRTAIAKVLLGCSGLLDVAATVFDLLAIWVLGGRQPAGLRLTPRAVRTDMEDAP